MSDIDTPIELPRQTVKVNFRWVFDGAFLTFIVAAIFYTGEETNRITELSNRVAEITSLNVDHRITTLDEREQAIVKQLDAIALKQDGMIEQLSKLTANEQDDRRYGSTLPPSARRN